MKEIIESITKEDSFKVSGKLGRYEGFIIKTNKQEVKIGISNYQNCCEDFGSVCSEDSLSDYVGAEVTSLKIVDEKLETIELTELYEGNVMFMNVDTSNGLLQFAVYNIHNGYYAHQAIVSSDALNHEESL